MKDISALGRPFMVDFPHLRDCEVFRALWFLGQAETLLQSRPCRWQGQCGGTYSGEIDHGFRRNRGRRFVGTVLRLI